jgi:hypothetical protein
MKPIYFLIILVASIIVSTSALVDISYGSDWNNYGMSNNKDNFFYNNDIEKRTNGNIRVWIKEIKEADLFTAIDTNRNTLNNKVTDKIRDGYIPPIAHLMKMENDSKSILGITTVEEAANLTTTAMVGKMFIELDCGDKKLRILQTTVMDNSGNAISSSSAPQEWSYVDPDATIENLFKILCK